MKLTNEQNAKLQALYKKYAACEAKTTFSHNDYDCNTQQRSATTRAYNTLVKYIESVTDEPTHKVIFNLVNA